MNFTIEQLNFLYLYNHCKLCHLDVLSYNEIDINDITEEDISNLLCYLLVNEKISTSFDECIFNEKVEKYINQTDTLNLSTIGSAGNKQVQKIIKFKKQFNELRCNSKDRLFTDKLDELLWSIKDIKSAIQFINKVKEDSLSEEDKKRKNKRIVNILFS